MSEELRRRALITGVTGQDGSYLAELLLAKGYEVHGLLRRASTFNTQRLDAIYRDPHETGVRFRMHHGDLGDSGSLINLIRELEPDEVYHLGAQSHVKVSFETPEYTANTTGLGTIRILEAIRASGIKARFYQASSSEMFGAEPPPQNETTPFHPRSPYGVAKVYGYWSARNYREAYGLFATNGILFNHETVVASTPLIVLRKDGFVDIKPIREIVRQDAGVAVDESRQEYQAGFPDCNLQVWDKYGWTRVTYASGYPHSQKTDARPKVINARSAAFCATSSHVVLLTTGGEKPVGELSVGERLAEAAYPELKERYQGLNEQQAELLGIVASDGWIPPNYSHIKVASASSDTRAAVAELWLAVGGRSHSFNPSPSGFNRDKVIGQVVLKGVPSWLQQIRLYNEELSPFGHRTKRVPWQVLNAPREVMLAFLKGYNRGDGLKANRCIYEFRNFKTNSATLAAGLLFLIDKTTGQRPNITVEDSTAWGRRTLYYSLNLASDSVRGDLARAEKYLTVRELVGHGISQRQMERETGISRTFIRQVANGYVPVTDHHLQRPSDEVKKIIEFPEYDGWFYDLETESGTFHAGVGRGWVHNSPRRGETFVSRKVTRAVARIHAGLQDTLFLGNLDARRDWGYAPEYCINKDVPILTPVGWRYRNELNAGDDIINFDPLVGTLSRDRIERIVDVSTDGTRVVLVGRGFFLRCTPGHRIFYQQKSHTSRGGWSDWKVTTAAEFKERLNDVGLRARYDYRLPPADEYDAEDLAPWSDQQLYLIGCLLAEGHLRHAPQGRGIEISVSQSFLANEHVAKRIEEAIEAAGLHHSVRHQQGGTVEWCFSANDSRALLAWFDTANIHVMPRWCFGLSQRQAKILFGALMDCDGHWGSMTYVSKRYALAADFQTIALLAGYRTTPVKQSPPGGCYTVLAISARKRHPYVQDAHIENDGPEEAWCVSTSHGTIISRDQDCIAISGNCEAMWKMLQQPEPDDFVIATGESHTVREFVERAFARVGLDWEKYVRIDPRYYRPSEVDHLCGDASKAKRVLGWTPRTTFTQLVDLMVDADIELLEDQLAGRLIATERE